MFACAHVYVCEGNPLFWLSLIFACTRAFREQIHSFWLTGFDVNHNTLVHAAALQAISALYRDDHENEAERSDDAFGSAPESEDHVAELEEEDSDDEEKEEDKSDLEDQDVARNPRLPCKSASISNACSQMFLREVYIVQ